MSHKTFEQTYYQILELPPNAGQHEVVAAYHKAKLAYSPDSPALYTMFTKEEAQELLKLIEEAFRVLSNQNSRREYDNILLSRTRQPTESDLPDFAPLTTEVKEKPLQQVKTQMSAEYNLNKPLTNSQIPIAHPTAQTIPAGFAKSRLSVYEIKDDLEKEIVGNTNFDGAYFKKIRSYKNINLEQLSRETRISRSYLAAIEADDFEALPAPVFLRGFVIQLARLLGLDENRAATSYLSRVKK